MAALPRPLSHYAAAAASRWLLPEEILDLLTHAGRLNLQTSGAAPDRPPSGACYLFDRRVCRRFRADGHGWTSRGDSNRVREDHVRLRVDGTPRVAAAHAHHADDPQFHRRTYQLIDEGAPLSLVHYRRVLPREAGARVVRRREAERQSALLQSSAMDTDLSTWAAVFGEDDTSHELRASPVAVDCLSSVKHPPATIQRVEPPPAPVVKRIIADVAPRRCGLVETTFLICVDAPLDPLQSGERLAVRFSGGLDVITPATKVNPYCVRCVLKPQAAGRATLEVVAARGSIARPLTKVDGDGVTVGPPAPADAALDQVRPAPTPADAAMDDEAPVANEARPSKRAATDDDAARRRTDEAATERPADDGQQNAPRVPLHLDAFDANTLSALSDSELDAAVEQLMLRVVGQMGRLAATPQDLREELDAPDAHGLSLCHYCALYGLADLVDALLSKGASPDGPTASGETPLHLAAAAGKGETVSVLLKRGADPLRLDNRGRTARDVAHDRGHIQLAEALGSETTRRPSLEDAPSVPSEAALLHMAFSSLSIQEKCALALAKRDRSDSVSVITDSSDQESLDAAVTLLAPDERQLLEAEAVTVTANARGWIARRHFVKVRDAARTLEARWLEHRKRDRTSLEKIPEDSEPLTKFQAAARGALARGQLATIKAQMLALLVISRGFRDKLRNP
jgi:ankyrin repeat protein